MEPTMPTMPVEPTGPIEPEKPKKSKIIINILVGLSLIIATATITYFAMELRYNNKANQEDKVANTTTTETEVAEKEPEMKEFCAENEKICFEHPEDWQVKSEPAKGGYEPNKVDVDLVKLTSPSGGVSIVLKTGITGLGGACLPENEGKLYVEEVSKTNISTKADEYNIGTASATSIVTSNRGGNQFTLQIGLSTNKAIINRTSTSACDGGYHGMIDGRNVKLFDSVSGQSDVGVIQFATEKSPAFSTLAEAKTALRDKEYQQAFDIIASAHYK